MGARRKAGGMWTEGKSEGTTNNPCQDIPHLPTSSACLASFVSNITIATNYYILLSLLSTDRPAYQQLVDEQSPQIGAAILALNLLCTAEQNAAQHDFDRNGESSNGRGGLTCLDRVAFPVPRSSSALLRERQTLK